MTLRDEFWEDPEVIKLKKKLLEAYYKKIETIKYSNSMSNHSPDYEALLTAFSENRGGALFFDYLGSGFGNGALVELADGSIKYDFISGIGAHFGHSHPAIIEANLESAFENIVMQGNLQQNISSTRLVQKLVSLSGLDHCFLSSSGAMAAENALKLMLQKQYPRQRLLAFENCFIGRTLALSQISDKPKNRKELLDNMAIDYIPFYDPQYPDKSIHTTLNALDKICTRYPNQHAGMCLELIQGEGGFYPGTSTFFQALMKELKSRQIAVYVDEIQTFGRTTQFFAYHHFNVEQYVDIVTIGKLSQVCATLYSNSFKPKPSTLSQTFTASTGAINASIAIINHLENHHHFGVDGQNMKLRAHFVNQLEALSSRFPEYVNGPFGEGLMIAFTYKTGNKEDAIMLIKQLFKNGLLAFISGDNPTRIRFLVPVGSVRIVDIDNGIKIIEQTIKELETER